MDFSTFLLLGRYDNYAVLKLNKKRFINANYSREILKIFAFMMVCSWQDYIFLISGFITYDSPNKIINIMMIILVLFLTLHIFLVRV